MRFVLSLRPAVVCLVLALFAFSAAPAYAGGAVPPAAATQVAPTGDITGSSLTFTWNAVPDSTWYMLWLGNPVMTQWYTADQARCTGGVGTCTVTLTIGLPPAAYAWYIRTWNDTGYGPWSAGKAFTVRDPTPTWGRRMTSDRRYAIVFEGDGVLDNETGLVWERAPAATTSAWGSAFFACELKSINGRQGWRLPSMSELQTHIDRGNSAPALATGHPFVLPDSSGYFWTSNDMRENAANGLLLSVHSGLVAQAIKSQLNRVWCVRGAGGRVTQ